MYGPSPHQDLFDEYCAIIEKDSPTASKKVRTEIIRAARALAAHPEKYQLDELRDEHSKNVRRFFRWSYKIVYEVLETDVVILNIYHTSRDLINPEGE